MTSRKIYTQELNQLEDTLEEMSNMVEASLNSLFLPLKTKTAI